jgi:hypothetical protein
VSGGDWAKRRAWAGGAPPGAGPGRARTLSRSGAVGPSCRAAPESSTSQSRRASCPAGRRPSSRLLSAVQMRRRCAVSWLEDGGASPRRTPAATAARAHACCGSRSDRLTSSVAAAACARPGGQFQAVAPGAMAARPVSVSLAKRSGGGGGGGGGGGAGGAAGAAAPPPRRAAIVAATRARRPASRRASARRASSATSRGGAGARESISA